MNRCGDGTMNERRIFSRVRFVAKVQINYDSRVYDAKMLDISLKGTLIESGTDIFLEKTKQCKIKLCLMNPDVTLNFDSELIYQDSKNLGFKFLRVDNTTMMHLRRLLELNIGDSDTIQKELSFLVKN